MYRNGNGLKKAHYKFIYMAYSTYVNIYLMYFKQGSRMTDSIYPLLHTFHYYFNFLECRDVIFLISPKNKGIWIWAKEALRWVKCMVYLNNTVIKKKNALWMTMKWAGDGRGRPGASGGPARTISRLSSAVSAGPQWPFWQKGCQKHSPLRS